MGNKKQKEKGHKRNARFSPMPKEVIDGDLVSDPSQGEEVEIEDSFLSDPGHMGAQNSAAGTRQKAFVDLSAYRGLDQRFQIKAGVAPQAEPLEVLERLYPAKTAEQKELEHALRLYNERRKAGEGFGNADVGGIEEELPKPKEALKESAARLS